MTKRKAIIIIGDGMADEPLDELGGLTPLEHAATPAMDSIARDGCSGTLLTLPEGAPTSSDVANMSILGCDLATEYCGRGPLEAAGRGIPLEADDVAFRVNLVTVEDGILRDFSAGHIAQAEAEELIALLDRELGGDGIRLHCGVSYRHILVLSGSRFSGNIAADKPDDNHGEPVDEHLPVARGPEAELTAETLRKLMASAAELLAGCETNARLVAAGRSPANGIWPWSGGSAGSLKTLQDKYGITGAVITAVDVIAGLGCKLGMDRIAVPGATGYIDTNYEGKGDAAIEAIKTHDLVYLHVEAIDEVSHEQDLGKKLSAIEDFDRRVVARVLDAVPADTSICILPDHPVPVAIGKHTRTPVPVAVRMQGLAPDAVNAFSERACETGKLGAMRNGDLMDLLMQRRTGE